MELRITALGRVVLFRGLPAGKGDEGMKSPKGEDMVRILGLLGEEALVQEPAMDLRQTMLTNRDVGIKSLTIAGHNDRTTRLFDEVYDGGPEPTFVLKQHIHFLQQDDRLVNLA